MDKMLGSVSGLLGMHRRCVQQRTMHVAHAPHKRTIFPSRCCVCSFQVTKVEISLIFMNSNHFQTIAKQRVEALSPIPYLNKLHPFPVKTGNPLDTFPGFTQVRQMQCSRGHSFSPKCTSHSSPKYNRYMEI